MRLCKVEDIKENDILAKPIITPDFQMLLSEGVKLKTQYIEKLQELNITEVYIEETQEDLKPITILKEELESGIKEKVKDILEKHTYHNNEQLKELKETADTIISNIIDEENVIKHMFDIKERNSDIYEHSISTCTLSILTALRMNLEQSVIHNIGVGCLLHDIGLRYLTMEYCNRDLSNLSDTQLAEFKKHPVYGYTDLQKEDWIHEESKNIILYHHERLDGSGYPLRATEIPIECRIVNVCDAFDELICGIGCNRVKVYEAIEYLKAFQNIKFDGTIVDAFLNFIAVYPVGSKVLTSEGEMGIVISQNEEFPNRPVIQIIKDKNENPVNQPVIKNLVSIQNIFIEQVMD